MRRRPLRCSVTLISMAAGPCCQDHVIFGQSGWVTSLGEGWCVKRRIPLSGIGFFGMVLGNNPKNSRLKEGCSPSERFSLKPCWIYTSGMVLHAFIGFRYQQTWYFQQQEGILLICVRFSFIYIVFLFCLHRLWRKSDSALRHSILPLCKDSKQWVSVKCSASRGRSDFCFAPSAAVQQRWCTTCQSGWLHVHSCCAALSHCLFLFFFCYNKSTKFLFLKLFSLWKNMLFKGPMLCKFHITNVFAK